MKILRLFLSAAVIALSGYSLITKNFEYMPYILLFLGVLGLVMGVSEIQAKRKVSAILSFLAASFACFVAIYTF